MKKLQTVLTTILLIVGIIGLFFLPGLEILGAIALIVGGLMGISANQGGVSSTSVVVYSSIMLILNLVMEAPSFLDIVIWALMILAFWNE